MAPKELKYRRWLAKVVEKLTLIQLSILDKRDITDKDYELLEAMHRMYELGWYPLYAHDCMTVEVDKVAVEQTLFDDKSSDNTGGIDVVYEGEKKEEE